MALEKYRFKNERRLPTVANKWNFLFQLRIVPWFDVRGRVIPIHQQMSPHLNRVTEKSMQVSWRIARRTERNQQPAKRLEALPTPLQSLPTSS